MGSAAEHRTLLSSVSQGSDITASCQGSFFAFGSDDSCLIYNDILIVAPTYKIGDPQARLEQPLGSPANDACTLKCPAGIGEADALVTCHCCGTLAVLRYSPAAARFITVQRITVASSPAATGRPAAPPRLDDPTTLVGTHAAADPRGRAVALAAARHRVAVFFAAAYASPSDPGAFEDALRVWQADPLLQAPQAPTATATPSGDDDAATSAAVRQALLGDEPLATAAAAEGRADEVVMCDADVISGADGGGGGGTAAATAVGGRAAVGDPPVTDSGAADSLARLSLSGGSGSGGGGSGTARLVSHAIGEPPGDAEQRRRRGLFLLEEPVTWSALQSLSMDQGRGMLSLDQPGGRAVLNKKQAIMRAAGFTDIAPHVSDGDHVGAGGATPKLFRAAAIEDVTFLDVPDPASAQPSHRGAPSGSRHGSMHGSRHGSMHGSMHGSLHGSIHGGHLGVSGHLRGDGGGPAIATPPVVGASPWSGSAAAADVSGAAAPAAPAVPTAKSGLTAVLRKAAGAEAEATAAAAAGAEDQGWARVHVVVLTGAVSASDAPERRMFEDGTAAAVRQECALLSFDLRRREAVELRRCDVNSADTASSHGPFNVGAAHTVLPVPGAPTSVTLLTPRFALFRDFCTPDWTAGEVGCWTCAVTPAAPTWSAPGIVPISAAAPQSKKLRRVPSMVPSHMLPAGAFDMSDGFSSDTDSGGSVEAAAAEQFHGPGAAASARHRFRRDTAGPPGTTPQPPAAGRVTAASWLQGSFDPAGMGSTRGGALGAGTRAGSRANLHGLLDRRSLERGSLERTSVECGSLERGSLERGSPMDDTLSTESARAQRRKRTFANAMQSDRPPRRPLSRVPGTSIIKATLAAKVPRSSQAPVTAIQLFVSSCMQEPCSLVAVTACIAARPSVRPADGHVPERAGSQPTAAAAAATAAAVATALGGEACVQCVRNVFAVDALAAPFKPGLGGPAAGAAPERQRPLPRLAGLDADMAAAPLDDNRSALDVMAAMASESSDPTHPCATRPPAPVPSPICLISSAFRFVMTASASGSLLAFRPSMIARPQQLDSRVRSADKAAQHVHHYRLLQEYQTTPPAVSIGTLPRTKELALSPQSNPPQAFKLPVAALAASSGQLLTLSQTADLVPVDEFGLPSVVHDLHACGGGRRTILVSSAMHAVTVRLPCSASIDAYRAQHGLTDTGDGGHAAKFSEVAGGACVAAASVPDVGLRAANGQLFLYSDRLDVYVPGRHPLDEIPMTHSGGFRGQCGTAWRCAAGESLVASAAACGGVAAAVVVAERGGAATLAVWSVAVEEGPSGDSGRGGRAWGASTGTAPKAGAPLAPGTQHAQQEVLMSCQGADQPDRSIVRAAMTCMSVEGSASCVALCPSPSPLAVPSTSAISDFTLSASGITTNSPNAPVGAALQWLAAIISWDGSGTIACITVDAPGRGPSVHILQSFDLAAASALHFPSVVEAPRPNSAVLWAPPQPPAAPAADRGGPDLSALSIIAVLAVGMRSGQLTVVSLRAAAPSGAPEESAFHRPLANARRVAGFGRVDSMRTIQGMLTAGKIVPECSLALGVLPVALQALNADPFLHGGTFARRTIPRTMPSVASLDHLSVHGGDANAGCVSCGNATGTAAVMSALHCLAASDTMHTLNLEVAPGGSLGITKAPVTTANGSGGAAAASTCVLSCTTIHTKTGRCTAEYGLAVAWNLPDASAVIRVHTLAWPHCAPVASDAPHRLHPATLPRVHPFHRIVECTAKPAAQPAARASGSGSVGVSGRAVPHEDPPPRFTRVTHVRVYSQTHSLAFSEPAADPHNASRPGSHLHTLIFHPGMWAATQPDNSPTEVSAPPIWSAPPGHTLTDVTPWSPFATRDPAAYAAACVNNRTPLAMGVRSAAHRGLLPPLFLVVATSNRFLGTPNSLLTTPELMRSFGAFSAVSKLHVLALHMQHRPGTAPGLAPFAPASQAAAPRGKFGSRSDGRAELYPPLNPDALRIRAAHTVAVHTVRNGALCALCAHQSHLFAACGTAIWTYRFPTRVPSLLRGDSPKAANMALAELPEPSTVSVLQPVLAMSVDPAAQLLVAVDCLHGVHLFSLPKKKATGRSMEPIQCIAGSAIMRTLTCAFPWPPAPVPPRPRHHDSPLAPRTSHMFHSDPLEDGSRPLLPWDVRLVAAMATGVLRPQLSPYQAAWLRGLAGTTPCGTSDGPGVTAQQRLERVVLTASRPSRASSAACRQAEVIAAAIAASCSCGQPPPQPLPLDAALEVLLLAELRTGADAALAAARAAAAASGAPLPQARPADASVLNHILTSSIPRLADALNDEFIPSWPPAVTLNTVAADEAEDLMLALFALYTSVMPQDPASTQAAFPKQTYLGFELTPNAGASPAAAAVAADAAATAFRDAVYVPGRPIVRTLVDALDRVKLKWAERPRTATPCSLAFMFLVHVTLSHYVAAADTHPAAPLFGSPAQLEAQQLRVLSRVVTEAEEALVSFLDYEAEMVEGAGGFDGAVPELMHGAQGWLRGRGYPADDAGGRHLSGDALRCDANEPGGQAWVRKVMEDVPGSEHIEVFLVWWYIVCTGGGWPVNEAGDMHVAEGYKADGSGYPDAHAEASSSDSLTKVAQTEADLKQSGQVFTVGRQGAVVRLRWDREDWNAEDPPSSMLEEVDACLSNGVLAAALCCSPAHDGGVLVGQRGGAVTQLVPLSAAVQPAVAGGSIEALDALLRRLQRALLAEPATAPAGVWHGSSGDSALWAGLLRQFATAPLHLQLELSAAVLLDACTVPAAPRPNGAPAAPAKPEAPGSAHAREERTLRPQGTFAALWEALPAAAGAGETRRRFEQQVFQARSVLLCAVQAVL